MRFTGLFLTVVGICLGGNLVITTDPKPFDELHIFTIDKKTDLDTYLNATTLTSGYGVAAAVENMVEDTGFFGKDLTTFGSADMSAAEVSTAAGWSSTSYYPFLKDGGIACSGTCPAGSSVFDVSSEKYQSQGLFTEVVVKKDGIFFTCLGVQEPTNLKLSGNLYALGIMVTSDKSTQPSTYLNRYVQPYKAYYTTTETSTSDPVFVVPKGATKNQMGMVCTLTFAKKGQFLHFGLRPAGSDAYIKLTEDNLNKDLLTYSIGFGGVIVMSDSLSNGHAFQLPATQNSFDPNDVRNWQSTDSCSVRKGAFSASKDHDCVFLRVPKGLNVIGVNNMASDDVILQLFSGPSIADEIGKGAAVLATHDDWELYPGKFFNSKMVKAGGGTVGGAGFAMTNQSLPKLYLTVDQNSLLMAYVKKQAVPKPVISKGLSHKDTFVPPMSLVSVAGKASIDLATGPAKPATSDKNCWISPKLASSHFGATRYAPSGDKAFNSEKPTILAPSGSKWNYCVYNANGPAGTAGNITFTVKVTKVAATETTAALAITAYRQSYAGEDSSESLKSHYGSGYPLGSFDFDDANKDAEAAASTQSYQALVPLDGTNTATVNVSVTVGTGYQGVFDSARLMIACVDMSATNPGTPIISETEDTPNYFCQNSDGKTAKFSIEAKYTPAPFFTNSKDAKSAIANDNGIYFGGNTPFSKVIDTADSSNAEFNLGKCNVANGSVKAVGTGTQNCTVTIPSWNAGMISDKYLAGKAKSVTDSDIFIKDGTAKVYKGSIYAKGNFSINTNMTLFSLNTSKFLAGGTPDLRSAAAGSDNTLITKNNSIGSVSVRFYDPQESTFTNGTETPPSTQSMPAILYQFNKSAQTVHNISVAGTVTSSSRNIVLVAALSVSMLIAACW